MNMLWNSMGKCAAVNVSHTSTPEFSYEIDIVNVGLHCNMCALQFSYLKNFIGTIIVHLLF